MKDLLDFLDLKGLVDQKEPMEQLDQRVIGVPLEHLDPLDLLESFLCFPLISSSREMLLHHQDQKERPEEMPSVNKQDLRRIAMLI